MRCRPGYLMIVECRPPWRKGLGPEWNPGCGGGEGTAGFWGAASWTMPLEPVSSPWMTGAFECSVDAFVLMIETAAWPCQAHHYRSREGVTPGRCSYYRW